MTYTLLAAVLGALLAPKDPAPATVLVARDDNAVRAEARWKINTHLFAANQALADAVDDGMVSIPPFGTFPVAASALRALRAAPASYRAGVLAPDLYPDMYVGGWFLHSDLSTRPDQWVADNWMQHVWTRARQHQGSAAERDKVMAFAFGYLTHGAGDMFAHTYVNQKADGAWITFTGPARSTAVKHVVLEGFIGEHTPPTDLSIDVWPRFVSNTLIKDATARRHHLGARHYQRWLDMYDWLGPAIDRASAAMSANVGADAPYWVKCAANPIPCARKEQMETWRLDINRGLRALVDSSESLGERLMDGSATDGVSAMTGWATEWVPKMFGAHAIGEGAASLAGFLQWAAAQAAPISEPIKAEVEGFMQREFRQYYDLYQLVQKPSFWMDSVGFPAGTKQRVEQEMAVRPGSSDPFDWHAFEPMYNSVILSKLILLDGNTLNELGRRAGVTQPLFDPSDATNVMLGVFRSMTQSYQWIGDSVYTDTGATKTRFGICGAEGGDSLPTRARCGIAPPAGPARASVARGFTLWTNTEARDKVFRLIFKGYGPGPGKAATRVAATSAVTPTAARDHLRALRAVGDHADHIREMVDVMRTKVAGTLPATPTVGAATSASTARPTLTRGTAGRAVPASSAAPAPAASATNWGERCCARDLAEVRRMLAAMQARGRGLQPILGRRLNGAQLAASIGQLVATLDAFVVAKDARSATALLDAFSRQLDGVAALIAGV